MATPVQQPVQPASRPRDDDEEAASPGLLASVPLNQRQVKGLQTAVTIMTGVLIVGLLTLFGRIIYLAARPSAVPATLAVTAPGRVPAVAMTVPLPVGAILQQVSLSGERLALHYAGPGGSGILLVDTISGQIISRIVIKPDPAKP
jgi:uncharacterized iron-regulated membrane protein